MVKYFCNIPYFTTITAIIGLLLIVLMVILSIIADFSPDDYLLDIVITGQMAGLIFLIASDLMRKALKLQERIAKLEAQIAQLTVPAT